MIGSVAKKVGDIGEAYVEKLAQGSADLQLIHGLHHRSEPGVAHLGIDAHVAVSHSESRMPELLHVDGRTAEPPDEKERKAHARLGMDATGLTLAVDRGQFWLLTLHHIIEAVGELEDSVLVPEGFEWSYGISHVCTLRKGVSLPTSLVYEAKVYTLAQRSNTEKRDV